MAFELEDKNYTKDEVASLLQKETDRRVNSALDTREEKYRLEMDRIIADTKATTIREIEENAKLTAEQLAQKQFDEKMKDLSTKERTIKIKENELTARGKLIGAGLVEDDFANLLGMIVNEDAEVTSSNLESFLTLHKKTVEDVEGKIKADLSKINSPEKKNDKGDITKEVFNKMSTADKIKFKTENPDAFKALIG